MEKVSIPVGKRAKDLEGLREDFKHNDEWLKTQLDKSLLPSSVKQKMLTHFKKRGQLLLDAYSIVIRNFNT